MRSCADLVTSAGPGRQRRQGDRGRGRGYQKAAAKLDADAERLADDHLRQLRTGSAGIDRHRVVQMIRAKPPRSGGSWSDHAPHRVPVVPPAHRALEALRKSGAKIRNDRLALAEVKKALAQALSTETRASTRCRTAHRVVEPSDSGRQRGSTRSLYRQYYEQEIGKRRRWKEASDDLFDTPSVRLPPLHRLGGLPPGASF